LLTVPGRLIGLRLVRLGEPVIMPPILVAAEGGL
jgi:hypothetical protein